ESIRTDSIVQDDSSRSGNDTDADDADVKQECNKYEHVGQEHKLIKKVKSR
ncbi:hypothetical protein Tco_1435501, partial [Tanacetum coccineum]